MKPKNPYRKHTLLWSLMECDWSDLTMDQIAEVLYTTPHQVSSYCARIKKKTGYIVPYRKKRLKTEAPSKCQKS